jgi:hypothetical protein
MAKLKATQVWNTTLCSFALLYLWRKKKGFFPIPLLGFGHWTKRSLEWVCIWCPMCVPPPHLWLTMNVLSGKKCLWELEQILGKLNHKCIVIVVVVVVFFSCFLFLVRDPFDSFFHYPNGCCLFVCAFPNRKSLKFLYSVVGWRGWMVWKL